jgi:cellulose synthase/poly-beta-1,6-N-acetylglucosamine synthase-like glycosyltransferase
MVVAFWLLVAVVAYGYFGYPLVVALAGRVLDRRVAKGPVTPKLSVLVAAFDEEEAIRARIANVLACAYPPGALEVIVASDGSTDRTVELASAVDGERVRVLDLPRRGKAPALASAAARATGEVLVFTDANTQFRRDALARLAFNFADAAVGGVVGHTRYDVVVEADSSGKGEDLYWRYDTWLKGLESRTGSVVSAHGGIYAIRRELFRPVEDLAVTDDFAISTAVVEQGYRLVFEPSAIGTERTMADGGSEFRRRVRLMTRGMRGVILRRRLLNPARHGFYAIALLSRKVVRRLLPLAFPPILVLSVALAPTSAFFAAVAVAQFGFLALALAGWLTRGSRVGKLRPLYVPFYFCLANLAAAIAFANLLRGERIERWTPQRHESKGDADTRKAAVFGVGVS